MELRKTKSISLRKRIAVAAFLLLICVSAFGFIFRKPLLTTLANVWIVNEAVETGDAIVILGGNASGRAGAAAELFEQGIAPRILAMNVALTESDKRGFSVGESERIHLVLKEAGVPTKAISSIGNAVSSSHEEALALREWVIAHNPKTIIVPTDLFHTRRVNWWFEKILDGTGTDVRVVAVQVPKYNATNWWTQEEGLIAFQNEVIKSGFYFLRH